MSEFSIPFKTRPKVAVYLTVAFSLVLIFLPEKVKFSFAASVASVVYAPFSSLGQSVSELVRLKKENQALRQALVKTKLENASLQETRLENQRLKSLLGLPAPPGFTPIAAKIIGMEPSRRPAEVTVNRGVLDGVRRNLPVINLIGLVGKVSDATPDAAIVELLYDPGCRVAARNQRSRTIGIVKWKSGPYLSMDNVYYQDDVATGDTIVTSGLGGLFPEGILIGTVRSVRADSLSTFKQVEVEPAVRFPAIEEVFILLPPPENSKEKEPK